MIPAFRAAICTLGSGSLLIAAAALLRDEFPRPGLLADAVAAEIAYDAPAEAPTQPADKTAVPDQAPAKPFTVYRNASIEAAAPAVILKPDEGPPAERDKTHAVPDDKPRAALATRLYHPHATSVADFERLIRPVLTAGVGTATADTAAAEVTIDEDLAGSAEPRPDVLLVRDRPEVISQIDAIFSDLEAAPKRIVIDALIVDAAIPDSVPPGSELKQSHFGVCDGEPQTALKSLRALGRVTVIATNQLQVIDRQWTQLEWSQRACPSPAESHSPAAADDGSLRLATKFRIRPSVLSSGLIRLEIHPTSSRLKEEPSARPEMATVAFSTDILVHAGTTAVIAGSLDECPADIDPVIAPAALPRRPALRHETLVLLMPRISREN